MSLRPHASRCLAIWASLLASSMSPRLMLAARRRGRLQGLQSRHLRLRMLDVDYTYILYAYYIHVHIYRSCYIILRHAPRMLASPLVTPALLPAWPAGQRLAFLATALPAAHAFRPHFAMAGPHGRPISAPLDDIIYAGRYYMY